MKTLTGKESVNRWRQLARTPYLAALLLFQVHPAYAQVDQVLKPFGGNGGGQYIARCNAGDILGGLDLRVGDDVDAIRPLCRSAGGPSQAGSIEPYPSQFGGNGGKPQRLVCPDEAPLVVGMDLTVEGVKTIIVNNIHLFCGLIAVNQKLTENPTVVFDGPQAQYHDAPILQSGNRVTRYGMDRPQTCPPDTVAVGINGRSGIWLDAVGLICGALPSAAQPTPPVNSVPGNAGKPAVSLGRRKTTQPNYAAPVANRAATDTVLMAKTHTESDPPICASARSAREAKSPAAPGLERQCAAARAKAAAATPPAGTPPAAAGDPAPNDSFTPPTFIDGARLWACADAAEEQASDGACLGLKAGDAYCRMEGFSGVQAGGDGALGVTVKRTQAGARTRAVSGDTCKTNSCMAVSELNCAP